MKIPRLVISAPHRSSGKSTVATGLCAALSRRGLAVQPFKKGPVVLAIQGGVPIVPVAIIGTRPLMPKGSFRIGHGEILVRVGEPIDVTGMGHADRDRLKEIARDAVVELRGGEGRTSLLPGEVPPEAVLEEETSRKR